jgi:peptidoglycan/LPS O-acetylase OafA/YrhL
VDDKLTPDTQVPSEQSAAPPALVPPSTERGTAGTSSGEPEPETTRGKWRLPLAAIVIVAGLVFLAWNLGWFDGDWNISHWWAFFILIAAAVCFLVTCLAWRSGGRRLTWNVIRWFALGIGFVGLTLIFLLGRICMKSGPFSPSSWVSA